MRTEELSQIAPLFPPSSRVLEIGAGCGDQAALLADKGHAVEAIDIVENRRDIGKYYPVRYYDGRKIPFPDCSFDVVYSSNVLEHVDDLAALLEEIRRVLKPSGCCIHVMPSPAWRMWTSLAAFPCALQFLIRGNLYEAAKTAGFALLLRPHGARGNAITEVFAYHSSTWSGRFSNAGYRVCERFPTGLFYTGQMLLGGRLTIPARRRAARSLGSACHVHVLARAA